MGNDQNRKRTLGLWALVAIGAGLAIGPGVVSVPGSAIALTGRSTGIAFSLAVIVGFITILPWFLTAGVIRTKGGDYTLISSLLGETAGGIVIWNTFIMVIAVSLMGLSAGEYLQVFFPTVNVKVVGFLVVTCFFLLNMFGVGAMSRLQNIMFYIMLLGFAVFIVYGITNLMPDTLDLTNPEFYPGGTSGFASAVLVLLYGCTAAQCLIYFGDHAIDARRDIPRAMLIVTAIIFVLYTLTGFIASNVLPVEAVANKTIAEVAKALMPYPVFVFFMIACPFFALFTTLNTIFISNAQNYLQSAKDGWLPKCFGYTNRYGAPVVCMTVLYLITMIPQLLNMNIAQIAANTALVQYIMRFVTVAAVWRLPKKFPEMWRISRLHMPMWLFHTIMVVVCLTDVAVVYTSIISLTPTIVIISLSVMAVFTAIPLWRVRHGLVHSSTTQQDYY